MVEQIHQGFPMFLMLFSKTLTKFVMAEDISPIHKPKFPSIL